MESAHWFQPVSITTSEHAQATKQFMNRTWHFTPAKDGIVIKPLSVLCGWMISSELRAAAYKIIVFNVMMRTAPWTVKTMPR